MAARQRHPVHAVAVDVTATRSEAGCGRLVYLGERRVRGIGPGHDAHNRSTVADHRSPDGAIGWTDGDRIGVDRNAGVLRRIGWFTGLDVCVAFPVAIGIDDEGRPALRAHL